jgi:hypothetical protein
MNVNTYDTMIYNKNTAFRRNINKPNIYPQYELACFGIYPEFIPGCCSPDSQHGCVFLLVILPGVGGKSKITNNQLRELAFKLLCAMILMLETISMKLTFALAGISLGMRWELMKKALFIISAALLLTIMQTVSAADDPLPVHAGTRILRSGGLVVEVGDPDSPDCRWNQGLRFSPVANIIQVTLNGLEFCYAPVNGGSLGYVGGLPMEFDIGQESFQPDPPGYNEGSNNSPFLKVGVGILRRNSSAYNFSSNYPIVELAQITSTWHRDRANFIQTLSGTANGYSG